MPLPISRPVCEVHTLGLVDYQGAWDLQNQFAAEIAAGDRPPTLLLLEHPHTYTFGRRGDVANLLWDEDELARRGITVHWVDRGGDVTYHGPGQLVGYPLLPLGPPSSQKVDYIGYIRKLEQVIIMALAEFGVVAKQVEGLTGVWVAEDQRLKMEDSDLQSSTANLQPPIQKLAAIGVKVDARGISRHGFALNVAPDMRYWEGIVGCGLPHPEVSLAGLLDPVPVMESISTEVLKAFGEIFEYQMIAQA
jgi:lipoate-protein ligase B